jgi:YVTN family beta-propeller protein
MAPRGGRWIRSTGWLCVVGRALRLDVQLDRAGRGSADRSRLYAVNTPDNRLEVFQVDGAGLAHLYSVPVGMEPMALAVRDDSAVWVVNHLSDSVSVVDVSTSPPRVVRTLLVGDEPRDIVFAGPGRRHDVLGPASPADADGDGVPDDCAIDDVAFMLRAASGAALPAGGVCDLSLP